jgi:hypothetical protein
MKKPPKNTRDYGKVRHFAEGGLVDTEVEERVARWMHGGKDKTQRALWNAARRDPIITDVDRSIRGLRASDKVLKERMNQNAWDAEGISDRVPRRKED